MSAAVHVLQVAVEEYRREPERVRWCFKCREHLLHERVYRRPVDPMSYYGPHVDLECVGCCRDHADFPGTYRDGPRYDFQEAGT